jgi:hypothetical protein
LKECTQIYSHKSLTDEKLNSSAIARNQPVRVRSYEELVETIAEISYRNQGYLPMFRGQNREYLSRGAKPGAQLLDSFHRPDVGSGRLSASEKQKRREVLEITVKNFVSFIEKSRYKDQFIRAEFAHTDELVWAVLQHYEVLPTPLLDLTQSIHVAASFAALNNKTDKAYVYMLGFESINANISCSWHERYQLIRLSSIMPKIARRPLYQEGYFLGDFPSKRSFVLEHRTDFSVRLMAKLVFNPCKDFFKSIPALPQKFLYPPDDEMKGLLEQFKKEYLPGLGV